MEWWSILKCLNSKILKVKIPSLLTSPFLCRHGNLPSGQDSYVSFHKHPRLKIPYEIKPSELRSDSAPLLGRIFIHKHYKSEYLVIGRSELSGLILQMRSISNKASCELNDEEGDILFLNPSNTQFQREYESAISYESGVSICDDSIDGNYKQGDVSSDDEDFVSDLMTGKHSNLFEVESEDKKKKKKKKSKSKQTRARRSPKQRKRQKRQEEQKNASAGGQANIGPGGQRDPADASDAAFVADGQLTGVSVGEGSLGTNHSSCKYQRDTRVVEENARTLQVSIEKVDPDDQTQHFHGVYVKWPEGVPQTDHPRHGSRGKGLPRPYLRRT